MHSVCYRNTRSRRIFMYIGMYYVVICAQLPGVNWIRHMHMAYTCIRCNVLAWMEYSVFSPFSRYYNMFLDDKVVNLQWLLMFVNCICICLVHVRFSKLCVHVCVCVCVCERDQGIYIRTYVPRNNMLLDICIVIVSTPCIIMWCILAHTCTLCTYVHVL